jgi:hypothetical protein
MEFCRGLLRSMTQVASIDDLRNATLVRKVHLSQLSATVLERVICYILKRKRCQNTDERRTWDE